MRQGHRADVRYLAIARWCAPNARDRHGGTQIIMRDKPAHDAGGAPTLIFHHACAGSYTPARFRWSVRPVREIIQAAHPGSSSAWKPGPKLSILAFPQKRRHAQRRLRRTVTFTLRATCSRRIRARRSSPPRHQPAARRHPAIQPL